ncbi:hypothetical protein [Gloeothece citriformis]|uniref:hypothetical protein n=1 Tax=Gloeothece citriformis TaxID=2546356 RepID=UPI0012FEACE1|nr:hypothetical protein [Gloeothece citriformis]
MTRLGFGRLKLEAGRNQRATVWLTLALLGVPMVKQQPKKATYPQAGIQPRHLTTLTQPEPKISPASCIVTGRTLRFW